MTNETTSNIRTTIVMHALEQLNAVDADNLVSEGIAMCCGQALNDDEISVVEERCDYPIEFAFSSLMGNTDSYFYSA